MRTTVTLLAMAILLAGCGEGSDAQAAGPGLAGAAGGAVAAARGPLPAGALRVQQVDIMDPRGFEKPMVAMRAFIPAGWKTQGGIVWNNGDPCASDYSLNWMAMAPDGITSVAVMPSRNWSMIRVNVPIQQQPNPCAADWRSAREYLEALAQRAYPGVRLLDYRPNPRAMQALQRMLDTLPPLVSNNMRSTWSADAGELLVAHVVNGVEVRETIQTSVIINHVAFADLLNPGQVSMETVTGYPTYVTFSRAPNGRLDFTLAGAIANSTRQTEEWNAKIFEYQRRKMEINRPRPPPGQPPGDNGHSARMDAIKAMGDASTGAYKDRDLTTDRMQRETIEAVRGVETYNDPVAGRPVQFDHSYDHAWRVNDGTYLLTKDPNFNPGTYGLEAQQLQVLQ